MRKFFFITALSCVASMAMAQTYKLTEMSKETFAAGGDAQWSFQKYEYGTGKYSTFTTYGDKSTCNFLDQYNPERVMGERITEINGYTQDDAGNYWAGNIRNAWYDEPYVEPNNDSNEKFIYISENFETYTNSKYAGAVSFTVPEDGYYVVNGTIVREDCFKYDLLFLLPRYRIGGEEVVDSAVSMGLAFAYGDKCGELEDWKNTGLSQGAEPRFKAQEPVDYSFAFYGKKGDIISFEANGQKYYTYHSFARACWARSFYKKLDIETVDKATAEANDNYRNPYDMAGVDDFKKTLFKYYEEVEAIENDGNLVGNGYGQYSQENIDDIFKALDKYYQYLQDGKVNGMNLAIYEQMLESEWQSFLNTKTTIKYAATGNYVLFTQNSNLENVKLSVADNNDTPFGYYWYDTNAGIYNKFDNFTKTKGGVDGWCRNNGEWMYLNQDGTLHPDVARTPAILFTAPTDGYYSFGISLYRQNPNEKVENPLYLRTRLVSDNEGVLSCQKTQELCSKQYGSVANDGLKGKAPIDLDFFVNLKAGDKVSADIDCYTSGRNSSAGSQITRFIVASVLSEDMPITKEYIESTGLSLYDPYVLADLTMLNAAIDSANKVDNLTKNNIGEDEGQYSSDYYTAFTEKKAQAEAYAANPGDLTQYNLDLFVEEFYNTFSDLLGSRKPFKVTMPATTAIRLAGTDKYIVQKNAANDHYYAAIMSMDDITAAVDKGGYIEDYLWTFTVNAHEDGGYYLTNENGVLTTDGYVAMLPPNPTDDFAAARLNFGSENKGDSLVAISRCSDGLYWNGAFQWKSPYDKMTTTSKPAYKFILCDAPAITPAGINDLLQNFAKTAKSVEYYTIDGRRVTTPAKGVVVKRTIAADGSVKSVKLVVK